MRKAGRARDGGHRTAAPGERRAPLLFREPCGGAGAPGEHPVRGRRREGGAPAAWAGVRSASPAAGPTGATAPCVTCRGDRPAPWTKAGVRAAAAPELGCHGARASREVEEGGGGGVSVGWAPGSGRRGRASRLWKGRCSVHRFLLPGQPACAGPSVPGLSRLQCAY